MATRLCWRAATGHTVTATNSATSSIDRATAVRMVDSQSQRGPATSAVPDRDGLFEAEVVQECLQVPATASTCSNSRTP
jgi:hypothetical protein